MKKNVRSCTLQVQDQGLFYLTAKVHKLGKGEGFNELTMRPVISNIGTATYETAKYLNSLLAPLRNWTITFLIQKHLQITLQAKEYPMVTK